MQKQIGRLLIENGLPKNAADLFRDIVQRDGTDREAEDGLGDAEFAAGDFASARAAYRAALKIDGSDANASRMAEVCDRILALDPTLSGVSAAERYTRSQKVLSAVAEGLDQCVGKDPAMPGDLREEVKEARRGVGGKTAASYGDAADRNLELAQHLWSASVTICKDKGNGEDPLHQVMRKLMHR